MTGFEIFKSGWQKLGDNKDKAVYWGVSYFCLVLIYGLITGFMNRIMMVSAMNEPGMFSYGSVLFGMAVTFLAILVFFVVHCGFSVGWIRQVSGVEDFRVSLPKLFRSEAWAYLGYSILIGLIAAAFMLLLGICGYLLGLLTMNPETGEAGAIGLMLGGFIAVILVFLLYVFLTRLSIVLVSRALSGNVGFGEALSATKGLTGPILMFLIFWILISILIAIVLGLASFLFMGAMPISVFGIIVQALLNAVITTVVTLVLLGQMTYLYERSIG